MVIESKKIVHGCLLERTFLSDHLPRTIMGVIGSWRIPSFASKYTNTDGDATGFLMTPLIGLQDLCLLWWVLAIREELQRRQLFKIGVL